MGDAQSMSQFMLTPAELADRLERINFLFWETLAELEPEEIESVQHGAGEGEPSRTAKMMVADIGFCDDRLLRRLQAARAGGSVPARSQVDKDARVLEVAKRPWREVEQATKEARQRLVDFTRMLTPEELAQQTVEGNQTRSMVEQLQERAEVVAVQRGKLQSYCGSLDRWGRAGLGKLMAEQHDNLMEGMAGLTEETMLTTQVCDVWSIRDVYAHVLGWNEYCARLLRYWPEPNPELISEWAWLPGDTMASFNERMLAARTHLTMIEIADGLTTEYRRMMRVFARRSDADLRSEGLTWGGPGIMSNFFYEIFVHEAEHAAQIWSFRAGVLKEEAAQNRSDDS